jgi:uncharacterized protein YndB with AHSA1/START domain
MSEQSLQVRIRRRFDVPAERVFDAWLDPRLIGQWMFGPALREEEILRIAVDARVGGAFSFLVRREQQALDHVGQYLEIDRPRRLAFSWGIGSASEAESRVTIDIVPRDAGCELTLIHRMHPKWAEYAGRTEAGWTRMLDVLAATLGRE